MQPQTLSVASAGANPAFQSARNNANTDMQDVSQGTAFHRCSYEGVQGFGRFCKQGRPATMNTLQKEKVLHSLWREKGGFERIPGNNR